MFKIQSWEKMLAAKIAEGNAKYEKQKRPYDPVKARQMRIKHASRYAHYAALRRANKIQATPPWANKLAMKTIYINCSTGYHVDHIIPLKHPKVCGLHCEANLQYLPALENIQKSNHFDI